ncbi:hypothetical protein [Amycolatopsis dendrobii]|uniref:Uncharacterized protein n=1 Tax=Amycolatopsis dendrobii TaxID=2760662 RepID=A0A7W3VUM3_9PSEU|nr:hypothetical protein [Amycolatopsis dendrobii]MBB1153488.1 hypothetical protein [Amycolatopsis dendrobii]
MTDAASVEDPTWSVGDDIGDGLKVVAVVEAVGARGLMCWCADWQWKPHARAEHGTFRPGTEIVYAARETDPFTVVAFHPRCVEKHIDFTDPIVRAPWGVVVTGYRSFSAAYFWDSTRAGTRKWVDDRPGVTVQAWLRSFTNDRRLEDDPEYLYVEDPANPLCETTNDAGIPCMEPATLRLEFTTGLVANVCWGCYTPISAAVSGTEYTEAFIERPCRKEE